MSRLRIPIATYRLQFNREFRFKDACGLIPYLHKLGVSDLYASPVLKARRGSRHGYDVTDPASLNPELGTEADFEAMVQELESHGMGLLLDIVPNHLSASPENPWWMDVLENGRCSPYPAFFDIDWGAMDNRVLVPILLRPFEEVLGDQGLTLTLEEAGLFIRYSSGYRLPVDVSSYRLIISHCLDTLEKDYGSGEPAYRELQRLKEATERLPPVSRLDPTGAGNQYRDRQAVKATFMGIIEASPKTKAALLRSIGDFNGKKGETESFGLMRSLLAQQAYQLEYWRTANERINYRRFFSINDLIGVRVEELPVFEAVHSLVFRLLRESKVSGLRIDHIDGLSDPQEYLTRLQQYIAPEPEETGVTPRFYVIVEKILTGDEALPPEWPVFGTTGYDFARMATVLFVDSSRAPALDEIYLRFTGSTEPFDEIVYRKKKQVMEELFPGEVRSLGRRLADLAHRDGSTGNLSSGELTDALTEVTACLPVYRTYVRALEVAHRDRYYLEHAIGEARRRNPDMVSSALDFLRAVLTLDPPRHLTPERKQAWLGFVLRWQQLTGAVMAKGFEDTALYCHNRLISLNEVGGDPDSPGLPVDDLHCWLQERQEHWPYALNATSTHDTKRSQDVRARISVLSEIPGEWEDHLTRWKQCNGPKKPRVKGLEVPEPATELLLYQTLLGAWPLDENELPEFKERLKAYMIKAVREARVFTSWLSPESAYENALIRFLEAILPDTAESDFLKDFLAFEERIAYYGALNSLGQVLLKITAPGIPDFYQGMELWDFSLVDPDNRRPVDFKVRGALLDELIRQEARGKAPPVKELLSGWRDGRVKLYLTYRALNARKSHSRIFREGEYIPLQVNGQRREHVFAFIRRSQAGAALVVVPRLLTGLVKAGDWPVGREVWGEDRLLLPEGFPGHWVNIFTGEELGVSGKNGLELSRVLSVFPVALLMG